MCVTTHSRQVLASGKSTYLPAGHCRQLDRPGSGVKVPCAQLLCRSWPSWSTKKPCVCVANHQTGDEVSDRNTHANGHSRALHPSHLGGVGAFRGAGRARELAERADGASHGAGVAGKEALRAERALGRGVAGNGVGEGAGGAGRAVGLAAVRVRPVGASAENGTAAATHQHRENITPPSKATQGSHVHCAGPTAAPGARVLNVSTGHGLQLSECGELAYVPESERDTRITQRERKAAMGSAPQGVHRALAVLGFAVPGAQAVQFSGPTARGGQRVRKDYRQQGLTLVGVELAEFTARARRTRGLSVPCSIVPRLAGRARGLRLRVAGGARPAARAFGLAWPVLEVARGARRAALGRRIHGV
jgi:hypothetical protein